jgi:hypothetical protein
VGTFELRQPVELTGAESVLVIVIVLLVGAVLWGLFRFLGR